MKKLVVLLLVLVIVFTSASCGSDNNSDANDKIDQVLVHNSNTTCKPAYFYEISYIKNNEVETTLTDADKLVVQRYEKQSGYIMSYIKYDVGEIIDLKTSDFFCQSEPFTSTKDIPVTAKIIKRTNYSVVVVEKADTYLITHYTIDGMTLDYPSSQDYYSRKYPLVKLKEHNSEAFIKKHVTEEAKINVSIEYYS